MEERAALPDNLGFSQQGSAVPTAIAPSSAVCGGHQDMTLTPKGIFPDILVGGLIAMLLVPQLPRNNFPGSSAQYSTEQILSKFPANCSAMAAPLPTVWNSVLSGKTTDICYSII
jgi:hypothetical protein